MGGRICLDRAHLAHTDTETVIRQAFGRSRGEEAGKQSRGGRERDRGADVCGEWGKGSEGKGICAERVWGAMYHSYPGPLKNQTGLRFEGPQLALSNRWKGVFVCRVRQSKG